MLHLLCLSTELYYYIKKRRDGEKTEEHTDTPSTEDPAQTGCLLDPGLECDAETLTDSAVPQGSVSEAEEKSQKEEVSSSLLDSEKSILEERVRELEKQLCEALRECERKHKVTLAESEENHKQATESVEQMQKEDADLKSEVNTLKDAVEELSHLLTDKHIECTDITRMYEVELKLRKHLESECKEKEEKFNQETSSLRVALNEAEWKYKQMKDSNAQLEIKNSKLWCDMRLMQDAMMELDEELSLSRIRCNELNRECELKKRELNILQSKQNEVEETSLKECEREKEAHTVLKIDQMTSTHHEELLQGIQAKAAGFYSEVTEPQDHLRMDEDELNKLQEKVQQLESELAESRRTCEEIKREYEREKEHHSVLKCDQTTSTHLMDLVHVSQAEAEEKFEYTAQLENENAELKSQVKTMQDSLQGLSCLLTETHRKYENSKKKHMVTRGILQATQTRTRKRERFLIQKRKDVQESLDDIQRKYTEAMERIARLEDDNFNFITEVHLLNEHVQDVTDEHRETKRLLKQTTWELHVKTSQLKKIDSTWKYFNETVLKDHEVECLAHGALKVQFSELKQQHDKLEEDNECLREAYSTLKNEKLKQPHKWSQMEREQEQEVYHDCQEMTESSSHTEESVRVRQQSSVEQLEEELTVIQRERKREQEDYNLLKAQCQQMEETLKEYEELLKIHCIDFGSKDATVP